MCSHITYACYVWCSLTHSLSVLVLTHMTMVTKGMVSTVQVGHIQLSTLRYNGKISKMLKKVSAALATKCYCILEKSVSMNTIITIKKKVHVEKDQLWITLEIPSIVYLIFF